ncbi:MAG TPA: type VI secretion system baseplate subunit TssE [Burkholderiaceae bacterium]|nr:type VI secretion system baseplate subunit TssE [Burkholderiaceae bacterium]
MATRPPPERDRLQPALLDRLIDDNPEERVEAPSARVLSKQQLRQAVLRDLAWLLNAVQPLDIEAERVPFAAASVLNYGLPPLAGAQTSTLDVATLEQNVRRAIVLFEPRILPDSLRVHALEEASVLDTHNQIALEITGLLWSQPVPLEVMIRTELDLETGQVNVREANRAVS